ncbi:MAG: patatin-like phospholipase family protein [Vicinamibacteria bacterium]|jgi:NTE family protein|nr:patatin-like phospholipase family protein [Vicinamibacteria bacterium]
MKPLYLALSDGGARAGVHVGALRALLRNNAQVKGIVGVAGGALVGAAYATGADLDRLIQQAASLHPWTWVRGWGGGFLSGSKLGQMIDEFLPVPSFDGLKCQLWVVATDVETGEGVVLREGNLRDAVRASCSFPGYFPPMEIEGRQLYAGGIADIIPVRRAREMAGEDGVVVAVDCNSGTKWPSAYSFVSLAVRAGLTMMQGRTRAELAGADLVVAPPLHETGWMRPQRIPAFVEAGEEAMTLALPELQRLLGTRA